MATKAKTETRIDSRGNDGYAAGWAAMANGDDGTPFENPGAPDRSVQVQGTFGVGGTVVLEGSNDGTNYHTLRDPLGNNLSFTAAGLKAVMEAVRYVRPRVTAGDGTTSITVTLLAMRRAQNLV